MPRIRITFSQLVDEILILPKDKEKIFEIWKHILMNGFIFNEFTLIVDGDNKLGSVGSNLKITYKVKVEGTESEQKFYIKIIRRNNEGLSETRKEETTITEFLDELNDVIRDCAKKGIKNYINWNVDRKGVEIMPPMLFMQYAVEKAMNREIIEMQETTRRYKPIKERKESKQKQEYKLFDVIRKYSKHINHNKHHIKQERWDVKGHFRHYKNGKVVYVKPYEKGKGRKKEREYKL